MTSFTDYLESIHGKDYVGTDDCMPDDFNDWLQSQDVNDICEYAEKYAVLTQREMRGEIAKAKTTNEYWMKRLNVPSSDYSYGHMHGWNLAIDALLKKLEEGKL